MRPALLILLAIPLSAQSPEFDAATLKPSPPPQTNSININLGTALNGRVTLTNATLADCIKFAYGIAADAQLLGPEWINSGELRYDIVAQAPRETPRQVLLTMLQTLLIERMKLVFHDEQRELRYLALVKEKTAPKLQPSKPDAASNGAPNIPGRIISPQMTTLTLTRLLSRFERQTVLDLTGLEGNFEIRLEWSPDNTRSKELEQPPGPTLFTAIQEQLGLRLESRKGPVQVLVVDSAEKVPAEN